jgi:hypothetical protein
VFARTCWFDSSPGHHSNLPFPKYARHVASFAEYGAERTKSAKKKKASKKARKKK